MDPMPKCRLETLKEHDLPQLIALYTDPSVRAFLGGPVDLRTAKKKAAALFRVPTGSWVWAVRRSADDAFLGAVYLDPHHDGLDMEVSYTFLPEHQGFGYATEAVRAVLRHAFRVLKLPRVVAETQAKNERSIRLLERTGMSPERKIVRFGEDQIIYAIDAESFG
jgi:ribosomal-protein-alanine N-acetyltransferase